HGDAAVGESGVAAGRMGAGEAQGRVVPVKGEGAGRAGDHAGPGRVHGAGVVQAAGDGGGGAGGGEHAEADVHPAGGGEVGAAADDEGSGAGRRGDRPRDAADPVPVAAIVDAQRPGDVAAGAEVD